MVIKKARYIDWCYRFGRFRLSAAAPYAHTAAGVIRRPVSAPVANASTLTYYHTLVTAPLNNAFE